MIVVDGSEGEGGGQVLRTSLTLALATGLCFRIENIRKKRQKPGLLRQHLTAVQAAALVSNARVEGDRLGSTALTFAPQALHGGEHKVSIGSAGSACLVLQTILPALALADAASEIVVEGGTHNPLAPTFDFLASAFVPILNRMGAKIEIELERPGFYLAGGGRVVARVTPTRRFEAIEILERGDILSRRARVWLAHLPTRIAERELAVVTRRLGWSTETHTVEVRDDSPGPGNVLSLEIECANATEVFTGFGAKDTTSEVVAGSAVDDARDWLASGAPIGRHLADQLMLPFALAGGGVFVTQPLTPHATTNAAVIARFLSVDVRTRAGEGRNVIVEVAARTI